MDEKAELSRRSRRAASLIAAALTAIVVAAFLYLRAATPTSPSAAVAPAPPTLTGYTAVYDFVTASTGWALVTRLGRYWIFRTVDGARNWQLQDAGPAPQGDPDVDFADARHGVISFFGPSLVVYRTSDAGLHWRPLAVPGDAFAVTFANADSGWALTWNPSTQDLQLLSTRDGGATWVERVWPSGAYWVGRGGPEASAIGRRSCSQLTAARAGGRSQSRSRRTWCRRRQRFPAPNRRRNPSFSLACSRSCPSAESSPWSVTSPVTWLRSPRSIRVSRGGESPLLPSRRDLPTSRSSTTPTGR